MYICYIYKKTHIYIYIWFKKTHNSFISTNMLLFLFLLFERMIIFKS